jgi:hypothetical protein
MRSIEEQKAIQNNIKVSMVSNGSKPRLEDTGAMNSVVNLAAAMDPISHMLGVDQEQDTERCKQIQLKFDLKLTDLSETSNPFVVFKNRVVDSSGYLIFSEEGSKTKEYSLTR